MKNIVRLLVLLVVGGAIFMVVTGTTASQAAPTPYASVLSDQSFDKGRRMTCDHQRCVRADVTPIECEYMPDENCACNSPGPNGCGNPGASCGFIMLCE